MDPSRSHPARRSAGVAGRTFPERRAARRHPSARARRIGRGHPRPGGSSSAPRTSRTSAPQAAGSTWYPYSFLAPLQQNEPWLGSALLVIEGLVDEVQQQGVSAERLVLMGFSQGACLALEFAARHARRYAAVVAFSGGLIGPPGTPRNYAGSFEGTPVFIGCSDSIRTYRSSVSANQASSSGAWAPASTSASTLAWLTRSSQTRSKPPMRCWQLHQLNLPGLRAPRRKRGTSRGPGSRRSAPSDRRPSAPRWQWHRRRR